MERDRYGIGSGTTDNPVDVNPVLRTFYALSGAIVLGCMLVGTWVILGGIARVIYQFGAIGWDWVDKVFK